MNPRMIALLFGALDVLAGAQIAAAYYEHTQRQKRARKQ